MQSDCLMLIGAKDETAKIYESSFQKEGYATISKTDDILIVAKESHVAYFEKDVTEMILNIAKKYRQSEIYFVDLTPVIDKLYTSSEKKDMLAWWTRQAITKAIVTKKKEIMS